MREGFKTFLLGVVGFLIVVLASQALAGWKPEAGDASSTATIEEGAVVSEGGLADASADANAQSGSNSSSDVGDVTNNNSTEITNPDDITVKSAPSFGLGSSRGNAGIALSFLGGGFAINGPWAQEDKRKLDIVEQLWEMEAYGAARRVMCTDSSTGESLSGYAARG